MPWQPEKRNWWEGISEADAWKLQYAIESAWSDEDPFATKLDLEPALLQVPCKSGISTLQSVLLMRVGQLRYKKAASPLEGQEA